MSRITRAFASQAHSRRRSCLAAAPQPIYVQFSGAAKGALYRPDPALFRSPRRVTSCTATEPT
jgi:hypothetical protein